MNDRVHERIASDPPARLVITAAWSHHWGSSGFVEGLSATLDKIRAAAPVTELIIVGSLPEWHPSLPQLLLCGRQLLTAESRTLTELAILHRIDDELRALAERHSAAFLSVIEAVCEGNACLSVIPDEAGLSPLAWNYGHLTEAGSVLVAKRPLEGPRHASGLANGEGTGL